MEFIKRIYLNFAYGKDAQEVLDIIASALQSNINLSSAVNEFYTLTENKKQKTILKKLQKSIKSGKDIDGLKDFFSSEEMTILKTYYRTGDLKAGIDIVIRIRKIKSAVKKQALSNSASPMLMLVATIGAIKYTNLHLIPTIVKSGVPENVINNMSTLFNFSVFISKNSTLIALTLIIILSIIMFFVGIKKLHGNIRKRIDKIPPFSLYKLYVGTIYIYSIAKLLMVNNPLKDAVKIASGDNPYLQSVSKDLIRVIEDKGSLGLAFRQTGWMLPDQRAVNFIRLIETKEGFKEKLNTLAEEYMDNFESKMKASLSVYKYSIDAIGMALMMMYILGTLQLSTALSTYLSAKAGM